MHIKSMISVPNPLILGYYLRCSSRFCHALSQLEFTMNFPVDSAFSALWRQKYGIWDDFQVLARSNSVQMPAIGDKITLSMREIQHLEDTENPDTQFCGKYWSDSQWLCTEVMKIIDRWNTWAISPHVLLYPSQLRVEWIPLEIMRCDFMTLTLIYVFIFLGGGPIFLSLLLGNPNLPSARLHRCITHHASSQKNASASKSKPVRPRDWSCQTAKSVPESALRIQK